MKYRLKETNLYPVINKSIDIEWEKLRRNQIIPWSFLTAGKIFHCNDFYGNEINYQGVTFEGSPREVFWGRYIEPFLEDISYRAIDQTIQLCNEKGESLREPLLETAKLLKIMLRKTYNLMADVDQRLRGGGYPQNVEKRKVDVEIAEMDRFIDVRVQSEVAMCKTAWKINVFYKNQPFLFWFITIIVSIVSVAIAITTIHFR